MRKYLPFVIISAGSLIVLAVYVLFSTTTYRLGFPLDDAWIHQTYARNLAVFGEWAYIPGQISGGSTAPLWTVILSVGYLLRLSPLSWVYFIGWMTLTILVYFVYVYVNKLFPENRILSWLVVAIFLLEYHLVWAALSGMETLLFALIILLLIPGKNVLKLPYFLTGLFVGLCVWIRPDGVLLLFPVILIIYGNKPRVANAIRSIAVVTAGFLLIFIPYLLFNFIAAGTFWPSTFYAKQQEYAVLLNTPLFERIFRLYSLPFVGVGVLLIPGFVVFGYQALVKRNWPVISGYLWLIGFIGLYVMRLPVTYQHGRYIIPILPLYLLFGVCGLPGIADRLSGRIRFILNRVWVAALFILTIIFWWWGGQAYALDVAVIESEMVDTALWVARETEPDAKIAAHDIGALGYFGQRNILDLAGLISPEVIPIIRDETALIQFVNAYQADFLVTFPDWYELLPECGELVYQSMGEFVKRFDEENMAVYRWELPCTRP